MTWANRHRAVYLTGLLLVIAGAVYLMIRPYINVAPTCFDMKQNGDEVGVDCGGGCELYCPSQIKNPVVLWSRSYKVTDSIYNAVAYVENQNPNAVTKELQYVFRLYDDNNILIASREGVTTFAPNGRQVIFEGGISVLDHTPKRTSFAITNNPIWYKNTVSVASLPIRILDVREPIDLTSPKVTATVKNIGLSKLPPFKVSIIVADEENNVEAVSQTLVDEINPDGSFPIVFTWPYAFSNKPLRYIIEPIVDVLSLPKLN